MMRLKIFAVAALSLALLAACGGSADATATTQAGVLTPQARDTTGTPTPTATLPIPTPTPIPAPGVEIPTPVSLEAGLGDAAYAYAETIISQYGEREAATAGELATAEYIAGVFEGLGYETEVQEFEFTLIDDSEPWLRITGDTEMGIESLFMFSAGFGDVEGRLVDSGLGNPEDFPTEGISGAVALISRGDLDFDVKARNAQEAGAVAAVIYNNEPDNFTGRLQNPVDIPVVSISMEDGDSLLAMMETGDVTVRVRVVSEEAQSRNVIARKKGAIDGAPEIVVGAQYDAAVESEGANNNASGTGALLAVAEALKDETFAADVTFVAFGGEQLGLLGSRWHVTDVIGEEAENVLTMINLDVVGSGERTIVAGDPALQLETLRLASELGVVISPGSEPEGFLSSHLIFETVGIPSAFLFGADLTRVNTEEDTLDFISADLMGDVANLAVSLVRSLANP